PFPEYVSGHSTFSGTAATVLTAAVGDNVAFNTSSPGLPGIVRSFTSFREAAEEAGQSRIYGGIHFQFSNQDGLNAGRELGRFVLDSLAQTADHRPPQILLDPIPSATSANLTVKGRVLDGLSGVAGLEIQIDGAEFTPLTVDAQGAFSSTTSFAVD